MKAQDLGVSRPDEKGEENEISPKVRFSNF